MYTYAHTDVLSRSFNTVAKVHRHHPNDDVQNKSSTTTMRGASECEWKTCSSLTSPQQRGVCRSELHLEQQLFGQPKEDTTSALATPETETERETYSTYNSCAREANRHVWRTSMVSTVVPPRTQPRHVHTKAERTNLKCYVCVLVASKG